MIRQLLDELHIGELIPAQEVLENETTQIRMGRQRMADICCIFRTDEDCVKQRVKGMQCQGSGSGIRAQSICKCSMQRGKTEIAMHPFYYDALLVVEADKTDVEKGRD